MYGDEDYLAESDELRSSFERGGKRYFKDKTGRVGRVYTPRDVIAQGGYRDRGSQLTRFETDSGDPLANIEALANEINMRDENRLAWVDRGRLSVRRGQTQRLMDPQGGISGLRATPERLATGSTLPTRFGAAKDHARMLAMAGRETDYRNALLSGDTTRANRIGESMLRAGAPPEAIHEVAKGAKGESEALAGARAADPGMAQWLMDEFQRAAGDPHALHALALQAESLGLGDAVPIIKSWATQVGMGQRAEAGREERAGRAFDEEYAGFQKELYDRRRDVRMDEFRAEDDERAERSLELREAAFARGDARAQAEEQRRAAREQRAAAGEGRAAEAHGQRMASGGGREIAQSIGRTLQTLRAEAERSAVTGQGSPEAMLRQLTEVYPELAGELRRRYTLAASAGSDPYAALENALLGAYRQMAGQGGQPAQPAPGGQRTPAAAAAAAPGELNWQDYEE